jgi:hypothetical protein
VIGVVLVLLALLPFVAWPIWKGLAIKRVSAAVFEKTKALVDQKPELKPMWDDAMDDGVLTFSEAQAIWERAGKKLEREE